MDSEMYEIDSPSFQMPPESTPNPEMLPPPHKKIKLKSGDESQPSQEQILATSAELAEIDDALAGPKKPGRKPGSGAGERRKKTEQYSTNKNSIRSKQRREKMSNTQKALARAATADRAAKSRALKKLRNSKEYQEMTPEERKMAEDITTAQVIEERLEQGYSQEYLRQTLVAQQALLQEKLSQQQEFLEQHSQLAQDDPDNIIFWDDIDSDVEADQGTQAAIQLGFIDEVKENYVLGEAIRSAVLDFLSEDLKSTESFQASPLHPDQAAAFKIGRARQNLHPQITSRSYQSWLIFRSGVLRQLAALANKCEKLQKLGDRHKYSYDVAQVMQAIQTGQIKTNVSKLAIYRQAQPFAIPGEITTSWVKMDAAGFTSPNKFFTEIDRGLLRSLWGADTNDWVDLPGPADWWPDDPKWYMEHGFEPRLGQDANYRKGLAAVEKDTVDPGWEDYLLHDNAPYDIVWDRFFGPSPF